LQPSLTASAQTRPTTETKPARPAWAPQASAVEANKIVGMRAKNDQGKDIGEIAKLIVDQGEGRITHVVLGRAGVLGVGEQKVVLAWSDLKIQPDPKNRNRIVAMVDQGKVDSAPRYEVRRDREAVPAASPSTSQPPSDNKK
jgi:sporulation protein YlmC with PRC-barrel domain